MEIRKALEIKRALITLANALDMSAPTIVSNICILDEKKLDIFVEASEMWCRFDAVGIIEKGKMLGIEITEVKKMEVKDENNNYNRQ